MAVAGTAENATAAAFFESFSVKPLFYALEPNQFRELISHGKLRLKIVKVLNCYNLPLFRVNRAPLVVTWATER